MKKSKLTLAFCVALLAVLATPLVSSADSKNLIVNGGFEYPVVTNNVDKWDGYGDGTPGLGWTVMWHGGVTNFGNWTRPETPILEIQKRGHMPGSPRVGEQYGELDSDWYIAGAWAPSNIKIYQLVDVSKLKCPAGTKETFQFFYSWAPRPGNPENHMQVFWNGKLIADHSASGVNDTNGIVWRDEAFRNLSRNNVDKFRVTFWEIGPGDSKGTFVDNVAVYQKCK